MRLLMVHIKVIVRRTCGELSQLNSHLAVLLRLEQQNHDYYPQHPPPSRTHTHTAAAYIKYMYTILIAMNQARLCDSPTERHK